MISSGLKVPTPAILIPAFAVPYAAPIAIVSQEALEAGGTREYHLDISYIINEIHTAAATPPNPMKGAIY